MKVSLALLLCFSIFTTDFVSGEQFYIVTSPDSPENTESHALLWNSMQLTPERDQ